MTVPPARQCTLPDCEREAVDPGNAASLCETHLSEISRYEEREKAESPDENIRAEAGKLVSRSVDATLTTESDALEAFADATEYFHAQLDWDISDVAPDDIETPRQYFAEHRGWDAETIDAKRLGYAPAASTGLLDHLMSKGYDRDAILGTGLFYQDLTPHFRGRYVFPYFDADGRPVYAISRTLDENGGHPNDPKDGQKYTKAIKTKDYSAVDEPIYGLDTLREGEDVLITEGMADAITAHEAGYPCISPVTKQFKKAERPVLLEELADHDIGTVYIVQDSEAPMSDLTEGRDGWDALTVAQYGEGLQGAVDTAGYLEEHGVDARLATLPLPSRSEGFQKVDLDDYLNEWADTLAPILASAKPASTHPAHDSRGTALEAAEQAHETAEARAGSSESALFDLTFQDVTGLSEGYRGTNPLGHHGNSENYFIVLGDGELGYDHKYKTAYNALTYLLCEAGERRPASPNKPVDDGELLVAWIHAKQAGYLASNDPVPHAALRHLAVSRGLCDRDDLGDGWRIPRQAYNEALVVLEEDHGVASGRSPLDEEATAREYSIVECEPPRDDREQFDRADHWKHIQDRVAEWVEEGGVRVFADEAGSGKTTNAGRAAADLDEAHAVLFDKHEKAREYVNDDATPGGYVHLKGAVQKREDACMDANHAGEHVDCPDHGHSAACPSMCPVYDLDPDDPFREVYEAVANEVGAVHAHLLLGPHDGDGCAFLGQFEDARTADRLVGVHEYLRLSTVTEGRLTIVDEKPRSLRSVRSLSVRDITQAANDLSDQAGPRDAATQTLTNFGDFAREVIDVLIGSDDAPAQLGDVDAPTVVWDTYEAYNDAAGHYMEHVEPEEDWQIAEGLARAKVTFNETILSRIRRDEWDGTPLCFDALLAAAGETTLPEEQVAKAIAAPMTLSDCPRCGTPTEYDNGARFCPECSWHEARDTITTPSSEPARSIVELREGDAPALVYRSLPLASDLPDDVLVLDATATASRIDALFHTDADQETVVEGDGAFEANLHTTQILDGQYHYGTITRSEGVRDRIQTAIETAGQIHDRPLFILRRDLIPELNFPDNGEVMHYHGVRGLNRAECDAVMCIGAPHPDVDDLRREVDLLTQHRDDIRVGGTEYSTRRDEATGDLAEQPPVYRKIIHRDGASRGRAIPTKAYSGLVGDLFRESREKELVQAVHRIRGLLADETKHAYLLTNVPTSLPIDQVATFDELTAPLGAFLPVPEGAVRLLEHVRDLQAGDGPDGFRASQLIETDGDGAVVFNKREFTRLAHLNGEDVTHRRVNDWVNALEDTGLLQPGEYEHRAGVPYAAEPTTLKRALSVLSNNVGFQVAAVRRFRTLAGKSDGSLRWLEWARDALGVTGAVESLDSPPSATG